MSASAGDSKAPDGSPLLETKGAASDSVAIEMAAALPKSPSYRRSVARSQTLQELEADTSVVEKIVVDAAVEHVNDFMESMPEGAKQERVEEAKKAAADMLASKAPVPDEARAVAAGAVRAVRFAVPDEDDDGDLEDQQIIIQAMQSEAQLMVDRSMGTVLAKRKTMTKAKVHMTRYFKAPAIVAGGSNAHREIENIFDAKVQEPEQSGGAFKDPATEEGPPDAAKLAAAAKSIAQQRQQDEADSGKFGTIDGVLISCLLNIFGVIMFLRLGWVVGQAGIGGAIVIILLAGVVTTLTTMSMAAIATNGRVKGGGAYYMISRALGPEIGGTIGTLFFVGLCVAISMYVIGFCETLVDNLRVGMPDEKFSFTGTPLNDIRIWGLLIITVLLIMALFGTGWVIKLQKGLMALLTCTILSVCIGAFVHFDESKDIASGFWGATSNVYITTNGTNGTASYVDSGRSNLVENFGSQYTAQEVAGTLKEYNFFSVFAIFFPAVTGIMAGANISGMLRDPAKNIVDGTFMAIFSSTIVYCIMAVIVGAAASREALLNDNFIMMKMDLAKSYELELGFLVLLGVYAATFSSALASLVGAPQMLFSVAKDRILPFGFFATTHKATWRCSDCRRYGFCGKRALLGCYLAVESKTDEVTGKPVFRNVATGKEEPDGADPVLGYFVSYAVACGCILIGDLNFVAPLISMFFMMTYGLINIACFALDFYQTPGWRPAFTRFSWKSGLAGGALCLICMFLTDVLYTAVSLLIAALLVLWIRQREVTTNWGTVLDAKSYLDAIKSLMHLRTIRRHAKTFRPKYLLLGGNLRARPHLGRFIYELRKGHGGVFVGRWIRGDFQQDLLRARERFEDCYTCLNETPKQVTSMVTRRTYTVERRKYDAFAPVELVLADSFYQGAVQLMQTAGVGALRPNTVVMGFKEDWTKDDTSDASVSDYVQTLRTAFKMRYGCMVCRNMDQVTWDDPTEEGTIDVWCLLNDGGLTQLVPYIMSQAQFWRANTRGTSRRAHIRLFSIFPDGSAQANDEALRDWSEIKATVTKYRFDWELMDPNDNGVYMRDPTFPKEPAANGDPAVGTVAEFDELPGVTQLENTVHKTTGERDHSVCDMTARWLRISEIIRKNSGDPKKNKTKMIFVTLPYPRSFFEDRTYMGILEILSRRMPPMVMIRGNLKPCLTQAME